MKDFRQGVEFSHFLFKQHLQQNNKVIDATAGNGHDTCFLAELVGPEGFAWAFDIQKIAVLNTKNKLKKENLINRVQVINSGHENIGEFINEPVHGILFNLGYLPGGNKEIKTKSTTTLMAVKSSLNLLKKGGLIVIVIYTGHPGGQEEADTLYDFTSRLSDTEYNVLHYHFLNQNKKPPQVLAIKKR